MGVTLTMGNGACIVYTSTWMGRGADSEGMKGKERKELMKYKIPIHIDCVLMTLCYSVTG